MVEYGIIKVYFGSKSQNKRRYGFICVTDEHYRPTGEEVHFHLNQLRQLEIVDEPTGRDDVFFSNKPSNLQQIAGEPLKGDYVRFEAEAGSPNRRVTAWTTAEWWLITEECVSDVRLFVANGPCSAGCDRTEQQCGGQCVLES